MSKEQVSVTELLLSLDSSELQEADQVRAAVVQQLSTDRGGAVLSSLVEYYLDSSSAQAVLLLSSIREPHHKPLLEKLNESLGRPGSRVGALTLLGHLVRKQPPWVHHISRSPLLPSLLRCLKTESDVVVLITGVLVLIALLPMIPQAGKQHIYDFFDVFGRLASWSYRNPGHVPGVQLVHLHAGVYSLFHRLYGMFPCNFISYLRLHYSMKENVDTFQEVVKPMLQHVRVHPELVTGTQDYELDPSRWRCFEVHDIVIECSRVSLDPLESSCEEDGYSAPPSSLPTRLNTPGSPQSAETPDSSAGPGGSSLSGGQLTLSPAHIQADDVSWSPSSHCGLSTPPPEPGSAPPLTRTFSISGVKCPSPASIPVAPPTEDGSSHVKPQPITEQEASSFQPITVLEAEALSDVIGGGADFRPQEVPSHPSSMPLPLTSTPSRASWSSGSALCSPPFHPGTVPSDCSPAPPYEQLFELALPRAATRFIATKAKEAVEQDRGGAVEGEDKEEEQAAMSPLKVLDQLIIHGHDAHQRLSRRSSAGSKSGDRSLSGGKQQGMRTKGPAYQGEELQSLRSQLLLVHAQLQYERFKRQQHAIRNRRLLRRIINATALEEHSVAMRAQLSVQDEEIHSLRLSLQEEQRRLTVLQQDSKTQSDTLHKHTQLLQLQLQEEQREGQRLQSELQECHSRLRDLEAELQKASNKAYNADHQLTQLSLKLSSSEQLQQQIFLLNQQLTLLRETNRALVEQLDRGETTSWTEASMLQCSVGKEYQRLRDSEVQHRQKLEAANHRTAELEAQLAKKEQLIQDQKKLLEDTKTQSRCEMEASESRCVALRRLTQTLQAELLQLYSQIQQDSHTHSRPQSVSRSNGGGVTQSGFKPRLFSSSASGEMNGALETLSSSPLHLPSCSSSPLSHSPIESPLAIGSFLEQHARHLFGSTNPNQEEVNSQQEEEEEIEVEEEEEEEEEAQPESPPLGQEVIEASLLSGSPPTALPYRAAPPTAAAADLTLAVRQRRHELSIMDYDETLPEY